MELREIAKKIEGSMQCNCDLDRWEPEKPPAYSGHSWVCRIHKKALAIKRGDIKMDEEPN